MLRQFGWLTACVLAVTGNLMTPSPAALAVELSGAAIFAVGTVRPSLLRPLYLLCLLLFWPLVWPVLRLLRPGLAADLAVSTTRRLRPRRRLPQS